MEVMSVKVALQETGGEVGNVEVVTVVDGGVIEEVVVVVVGGEEEADGEDKEGVVGEDEGIMETVAEELEEVDVVSF